MRSIAPWAIYHPPTASEILEQVIVSDNVLQATLQAGIQDESMRDDLALHTGRLDTCEKMVVEDQAIARTRLGGSYRFPMDLSALEREGEAKDAKGKGMGKEWERAKKARTERAIMLTRIWRKSTSTVTRFATSKTQNSLSTTGENLLAQPVPQVQTSAGTARLFRCHAIASAHVTNGASRKTGRQKIKSPGCTVCKTAEATMILPWQEKRVCGYHLNCATTTVLEPCCY